jgi:glycosyltransferase involved in cell wall biosynthesis
VHLAGIAAVVYVDSGSTDDSVTAAKAAGAQVVELDMSRPFSAARARNAGMELLITLQSNLQYVQFVDGDCVIDQDWLGAGIRALDHRPDVAAVSGKLRERHPERTIYNALCDLEWEVPPGLISSCGGIAMMRVDAFRSVGGFNPNLIAGEEPDLCLRFRSKSWQILKISEEMALHDADIRHFSQWWKRSIRWGYAAAELAHLHGTVPESRRWRHVVRRSAFWSLGLPIGVIVASGFTPASALALVAYPVQATRIYLRECKKGRPPRIAAAHATLSIIDKFSETLGSLKYLSGLVTGHRARIIEHKEPQTAQSRRNRT